MNSPKLTLPWEERVLHSLEQARNRALSAERVRSLRELLSSDYEAFWAEVAEDIEWFKPWQTVLEDGIPATPEFRFFTGGYANAGFNMLDRHLQRDGARQLALIWEDESGDRVETYTYLELYHEVCRFSNALTALGLSQGDRIAFFLPNCPAMAIALLSAYRMGLVFMPLFTGFSVESLRVRIDDFQPETLVTVDGTRRRGQLMPLKDIVDQTLAQTSAIKRVIVKKNGGNAVVMVAGRDFCWDDICATAALDCPPAAIEANEIQCVMYTSGTTGKPKGAALSGVGLAVQTCLGGKIESALVPGDVFYSLNDNSWAGSEFHALLPVWLNGATLLWQEGAAFARPSLRRFYETIEKYQVNKVHLAPTVLRMLRAAGDELLTGRDLSRLELMLCMGEPLSPELWLWAFTQIGRRRMFLNNVGDMTELGGCIIQPCAFIDPMKPGAMGRIDSLMSGVAVDIIDENGNSLPANSRGMMVFKRPVPGASRTLWGNHQRYLEVYFQKFGRQWLWVVQDEGVIDEDGYFWVLGRLDDTINVAGHRLTTSEIEGVIIKRPEVEAVGVIGIPDPIKEQVPVGFIQLKAGLSESPGLREEINREITAAIGAFARLEEMVFVAQLPTTISGKIMRRVLRDIRVNGEISGDRTSLENAGSIELLKTAIARVRAGR
ncbi:MAG: AMP-binding protein [Deltaproteobacteria bacterium]|nr:AMP-binding protein [Deltaproteobacteria bacterium]